MLVFLPVLEELELYGCHDLTRLIWDDQILPSSASFHNLTKLLVEFCNSLEYLFSSAVAMSFVQLRSLVLRDCPDMKEIVRNSENMVKMSFPKLNFLRIDNLGRLITFSSEIDINFPILTKLYMEDCPEFLTFISKSEYEKLPSLFNEKVAFSSLKNLKIRAMKKLKMIANNADVFQHLEEVEVIDCPSLKSIFPLSIAKGLSKLRKLYLSYRGIEQIVEAVGTTVSVPPEFVFPRLEEMKLYHLENLVCIYPGLHTSSWPLLATLVVEKCEKVKVLVLEFSCFQDKHVHHDHDSSSIPQVPFSPRCPTFKSFVSKLEEKDCTTMTSLFNDKRRLHNLKRLEISDCEMVEEVFEIQMPNVEGIYNVIPSKSKLIGLSLVRLSKLKNVWSKDPQGTLTFPHLKEVTAESCPNLESIFLASIGKGLFQLQTLHISDCGIEYIVGVSLFPPCQPATESSSSNTKAVFVSPDWAGQDRTVSQSGVCFVPNSSSHFLLSLVSLAEAGPPDRLNNRSSSSPVNVHGLLRPLHPSRKKHNRLV
ncbi:hypothetical protein FEM48_Zijuj03G0018400 [Ziziphus jujuba var. spinosa]|uniref:Disease resistance protein At4g27190-like leucine-rich repeats domain-containing protein n=1 Tax=Ziziphus jujuba var. spinosa TaxID=714518 RepID=A0A978VMG2_ZIZJJ|nr:hypothetical protein FEM48_Zijuj03G0018400 [Ziziphus jujuba var. spinosa]